MYSEFNRNEKGLIKLRIYSKFKNNISLIIGYYFYLYILV
ncbi:hypothetical protein HMPREF0397_0914 [Fusobacterium nucleatum subsp. nucleatum ATCC 23726]|uniref:Uncharacterized protein n=1 Tax=Fusobacterium nucleatum subsp. nucleatum (strain ATCC 23726 / VPI 4351) TaxID=525283 RepID=D5RCH9_FUSN2|nr:hypothetical protein HMPREF0397_0914 [Fusobacterium nucleatum subsp. nucleatum ATCC 23726]